MRKRRAVKRDVLPDPIYNSKVVTKLINQIMNDGKKGTAQTILYKAFDMIKEKTNEDPITIFEKAMENIGGIVENPDSYVYLSGLDNLKLYANVRNIGKERIDEVVKLVGLEDRINDKVSKYSLGMKQRLGLAITLLHKPKILILDEPTNGLDPAGIKDLRNILKKYAIKVRTKEASIYFFQRKVNHYPAFISLNR